MNQSLKLHRSRTTEELEPADRMADSQNHPRTFNIHDPDSESEDTEPESPVAVTPKKSGTLGRGRPLKLFRNRLISASPGGSPQTVQSHDTFRPMTIVTENMTTEAVDRSIEDAREADTEIHIKDPNGKRSLIILQKPLKEGRKRKMN